jgi:hypothetical protein
MPDSKNSATFTDHTYETEKAKRSTFDDDTGAHVVHNVGRIVTSRYSYRPYGDERVGAAMEVDHQGPTTTTTYPKNYQHDESWAEKTAKESGQIPLFTHDSTRSTSTGTYIQSTEGAKAGAMVLFGIADMDSRKRYGRPVTPDGNRSNRSERMVTKLASTGGLEKTKRTDTNKLDYWPSYLVFNMQPREVQLPNTAVTQGRRHIRQMLKRPRPTSVLGEQLSFDI